MALSTDLSNIRNIGICAHIDAGKTTVSERILFYTGKNYKIGEVHEGTATMDFLQDEQERGITIQSAATTCPWTRSGKDYKINLIDTPGHVDFTIEVERSLRVLDGACAVFDGKEGVEAQSETVWRQADRYRVPRLCFINKMDKLGASFDFSYGTIKTRLGANGIPIQCPMGSGHEFKGIIDLVTMKAFFFEGDKGEIVTEKAIPEEFQDYAMGFRKILEEKVGELDDHLMDKFLNEQPMLEDEIKAALRKGTVSRKCNPVLCGAALRNIGVQMLLDAVIDYLPCPTDREDVEGTDPLDKERKLTRPHDPNAPFSALVFKVVSDQHGDLTYMRVYSGKLAKGTRLLNPGNNKKENASRIFEMHAQNRIPLEEVTTGNIVAVVGIKDSYTGDTLCDPDNPIILERMTFPEPVISMSIEPKTTEDKRKLSEALMTIRREDPSFRYTYDEETAQTIISGMGELHLDIITTKLKRDMKIGVEVGRPKVSYRETITRKVEYVRGKFVKQTGGRGQFGDCTIHFEPYTEAQALADENDFENNCTVVNETVGGSIPKEYIPSVMKGIRETCLTGVKFGYQMINVKATIVEGSYHAVDSSQVAFEQAGRLAVMEAAEKANPVLLEPIMKVVITVPNDYLGNVTGDVSSRRGMIIDTEDRDPVKLVTSEIPLSELFGYTTSLRGMSQGRASATMEFLEYRQMPASLQKEMMESKEKAKK
jgi:elongation factor G